MSGRISAERLSREILDLDENTSHFETLEGISAAQASRSAFRSSGTVAAHVRHMRLDLDVLEEVTPAEWGAAKREQRARYDRALATPRERGDREGEGDIGGALSILAHTACHPGAIRQALAVIREGA